MCKSMCIASVMACVSGCLISPTNRSRLIYGPHDLTLTYMPLPPRSFQAATMTSIKRSLLETPPPASDPASGPDNSIIKRSPGKKQKSPGGSPRGSKADKAGGEDGKKSVSLHKRCDPHHAVSEGGYRRRESRPATPGASPVRYLYDLADGMFRCIGLGLRRTKSCSSK